MRRFKALLDDSIPARMLYDANFNVVAMVDGQGNVGERYRYDAYGNVRVWNQNGYELVSGGIPFSGPKNEILFQGRRRDSETGLYSSACRESCCVAWLEVVV